MNAKIFGEIDSIYFDLHSESINCKYNRIFIFTSLGATKDTLVKLNSLFYAGN